MKPFLKSSLDIFFAVCLLFMTWPLFILISIGVKLDSAGPVFFIQQRTGKNGKLFKLYKFRSLSTESDPLNAILAAGDDRITRVGKWLRPTGLDELPQLFNILKGDMSFIGPRAALVDQAKHYSEFQKKRLLVKPGLTGLVAVSGGHRLSWAQRIRLDVWYVRHHTLLLDLALFFRTFPVLIFGRELYGQTGTTEIFVRNA